MLLFVSHSVLLCIGCMGHSNLILNDMRAICVSPIWQSAVKQQPHEKVLLGALGAKTVARNCSRVSERTPI